MKVFRASALLVAILAVAGCGSAKVALGVDTPTASQPGPVAKKITATGTRTISGVKTGTVIVCTGGPAVTVPDGWTGQLAAVSGPGSHTLQATRLPDGNVTVSCGR